MAMLNNQRVPKKQKVKWLTRLPSTPNASWAKTHVADWTVGVWVITRITTLPCHQTWQTGKSPITGGVDISWESHLWINGGFSIGMFDSCRVCIYIVHCSTFWSLEVWPVIQLLQFIANYRAKNAYVCWMITAPQFLPPQKKKPNYHALGRWCLGRFQFLSPLTFPTPVEKSGKTWSILKPQTGSVDSLIAFWEHPSKRDCNVWKVILGWKNVGIL